MGWGGGYSGMGPWGGGGWWMPVHGLFSLLILVLVIAGIVVLVRMGLGGGGPHGRGAHRSSGLDLLDERYAKGEIDREDYLQRKRDLMR